MVRPSSTASSRRSAARRRRAGPAGGRDRGSFGLGSSLSLRFCVRPASGAGVDAGRSRGGEPDCTKVAETGAGCVAVAALSRILEGLDTLSRACGYVAAVLVVGIAALILTEIFCRTALNVSLSFAWSTARTSWRSRSFLAAAFTLRTGGHVRVMLLSQSVPPRAAHWLDVFATLAGTVVAGWLALVSRSLRLAVRGDRKHLRDHRRDSARLSAGGDGVGATCSCFSSRRGRSGCCSASRRKTPRPGETSEWIECPPPRSLPGPDGCVLPPPAEPGPGVAPRPRRPDRPCGVGAAAADSAGRFGGEGGRAGRPPPTGPAPAVVSR